MRAPGLFVQCARFANKPQTHQTRPQSSLTHRHEDVPNFVNQQMTPNSRKENTHDLYVLPVYKATPCVRYVSRSVQSTLVSAGAHVLQPQCVYLFCFFFVCVRSREWCAPRLILYAGTDRRSEINMKCLGIRVDIHHGFLRETWQTEGQPLL
jgi:hypothetical protein